MRLSFASRCAAIPSIAAAAVFLATSLSASAQVQCTMPNGVVITQQLSGCPRGAVAAHTLDGTPIPIESVQQRTEEAQRAPKSAPTTKLAAAPATDTSGLSATHWLIMGILAFGLYLALKGSAGKSGPVKYCTTCGHKGRGTTRTRGSLLIEIVLWLCFLVPGLIYSIWRHTSRHKVCANCGSTSLVPTSSPVARTALRHEDASPEDLAGDRAAGTSTTDSWEGSFYDAFEQRSAKKSVRITYRDGNDSVTERIVDIRAFEPHGSDGLVIGLCRLRRATRTFRFDRMLRVVDEETGEIIPDLQQQLNTEWEASPEPVLDALYSEHGDLLKMMLFAAKADGAMRAAEVQVIAGHCVDLTGDDRITPALVREMLMLLGVPTITGFTRIYNKLRRERPDAAARVAQACRDIVGTHKKIHPAEQAMLDALAKPLPARRT